MKSLRETVSELMVIVHLVTPALAAEYVSQMDEVEIRDRFRRYTGMPALGMPGARGNGGECRGGTAALIPVSALPIEQLSREDPGLK